MRKKYKKLISYLCTLSLILVLVSPSYNVYASERANDKNVKNMMNLSNYENVSTKDTIELLKNLNLSDKEINYLLELDKQNNKKLTYNSNMLTTMPYSRNILARSFPSNPSIGDVTEQTMYIGVNVGIGGTLAIMAAIMGSGIGIVLAATLTNLFIQDVANGRNVKGVYVTIRYTYGYTNDGVLGWNMGPAVDYGTY